MTSAALRTWLKVADATALTALETLQRALAYGRTVRNVSRCELFVFRYAETVSPREPLVRLAESTNLLLNPNKHRYELAVGAESVHVRGNAQVLVFRPGEGAALEETLRRHHLLEGEVPRVRRAWLWELDLEATSAEAMRIAGEIAVARERSQGLLANPHVDDTRVLDGPPSADLLAQTLFGPDAR